MSLNIFFFKFTSALVALAWVHQFTRKFNDIKIQTTTFFCKINYGKIRTAGARVACSGIFVPASVVFHITLHLLSDRCFKVFQVLATECSVLLRFRHNLMFVSP